MMDFAGSPALAETTPTATGLTFPLIAQPIAHSLSANAQRWSFPYYITPAELSRLYLMPRAIVNAYSMRYTTTLCHRAPIPPTYTPTPMLLMGTCPPPVYALHLDRQDACAELDPVRLHGTHLRLRPCASSNAELPSSALVLELTSIGKD